MKRKVALISKSKSQVNFIIDYFFKNNIEVLFYNVSNFENPEFIVSDIESSQIFEIILIGGDGTLHYWINQFLKYSKVFSKLKFGILPLGTGNDWIKTHFGELSKLKNILQCIVYGKYAYQDIGKINLGIHSDPIYFVNVSGIGFNGFVVNNLKYFKFLGSISYLISVVYSFWFYKSNLLKIKSNELLLSENIFIVSIAINQFAGGGMKISPNAISDDGCFDVMIIPKITIKDLFKNIFKLKSGNFINYVNMQHFRTSEISVENTKNLIFEADGEVYESKFYSISIHSEKLCFFK